MSSILLSSQSMALATAMAVSGTVILLAFHRLQKSNSASSSTPHYTIHSQPASVPPSCIITSDNRKKKVEKKKKRVQFAEDVVDPIGNSDEYRKLRTSNTSINNSKSNSFKKGGKSMQEIMPANRVALYNGMLRDKVIQKVAYSY